MTAKTRPTTLAIDGADPAAAPADCDWLGGTLRCGGRRSRIVDVDHQSASPILNICRM